MCPCPVIVQLIIGEVQAHLSDTFGCIRNTHRPVISSSHRVCLIFKISWRTAIFTEHSESWTGTETSGRAAPCFANLSSASLLVIPTWAFTQNQRISNPPATYVPSQLMGQECPESKPGINDKAINEDFEYEKTAMQPSVLLSSRAFIIAMSLIETQWHGV